MRDLVNFRSGFANVNGARLYYEIAGTGPAVALLHFGLADSRFWDDQFPTFAEGYTVVRYDYRGYGKSSMPPGAYSQHADLDALLIELGIDKVALVGVSMGGGLAIDYALAYPGRVTALVPVAAGLRGLDSTAEELADDQRYFGPIEEAEQAGDIEQANDLEVHVWVDGPSRSAEQGPASVRERVRQMNLDIWRRQEALKLGTPLRLDPPAVGRLGEIRAPTLVIIGDEDFRELQRTADIIAKGIPGATKAVMHGTAHAPNMEKPEEFNQLVLDFLGEHLR